MFTKYDSEIILEDGQICKIRIMNLMLEIDLDASTKEEGLFVSKINILGYFKENDSYIHYFHDYLMPELKNLNIDKDTFMFELTMLKDSLYSYVQIN